MLSCSSDRSSGSSWPALEVGLGFGLGLALGSGLGKQGRGEGRAVSDRMWHSAHRSDARRPGASDRGRLGLGV
eukprot:scaffold34224_cov27-Phaeocystis_antarctica.AAC.1